MFRVNSQCRNHTIPHAPHVHTVSTRCTECAPPVTRFLAVIGGGACGTYTYCGGGGGGTSPGSCGIVMRHSVRPPQSGRAGQADTGHEWNRRTEVNVVPRSGSTTARGYDHRHRRIRQALLAALVPGTPCPHCQRPMHPDQHLDLDHTDDRRGYRGLAHASCNRAAGAKKRNAMRNRPAIPVTSRKW